MLEPVCWTCDCSVGRSVRLTSTRYAVGERHGSFARKHLFGRPRMAQYPPHAIVMLSPLAALPESWAAPAVGWLQPRSSRCSPHTLPSESARPQVDARNERRFPDVDVPLLGRISRALQFSLLSLTFALLSMTLAERKPPMEWNLSRARTAEAANVDPVFSVGAVRATLPNTGGVDVRSLTCFALYCLKPDNRACRCRLFGDSEALLCRRRDHVRLGATSSVHRDR